MRIFILLSLFGLFLCQIPPQAFQKCQSGSYDVRVRAGQSATYVTIPKGVVGLKFLLSAIPHDVDITMLNKDSTKWIIFPCVNPRCSALISSPVAATAQLDGVTISYSGYKGLELSKPGVEYVEIVGELKDDVRFGIKLNVYPITTPIPVAMRFEWDGAQGCRAPPVEGLDLNVLTNTRNHKTFRYRGVPQRTLITRRGLEFTATLSTPGAKAGNTVVSIPELKDVPGAVTFSAITEIAPNQVSFTGKISVNSPVGMYKLTAQCNGKPIEANLVILFNPYLSTDAVYMPDQEILAETIENEEGIIWQGSTYQVFPTLFTFDQFEWIVLEMSLNLLRRMPIPERANIVLVSRHLSYAINTDVCYGKWGSDPPPFEQGKPEEDGYECSPTKVCKQPTFWKSMAYLAQVQMTVKDRVQYCQCFVFAAVTTAIGRTFGIPTRPVTNFQSAHDKNGNRAVDRFYANVSGRLYPIEGPGGFEESVWNFHVWNEMWMKRSDVTAEKCTAAKLAAGCGDGWQVVDSTPQELSEGGSGTPSGEGFFMNGPAPVALLKYNLAFVCEMKELGRETHPRVACFDQNFIIAEVNANINIWVLKAKDTNDYAQKCFQEGEKCGYPTDPVSVAATPGQYISTKAPGLISNACRNRGDCSKERIDLTLAYKKPEPSWSTTQGRHMWMEQGEGESSVVVKVTPPGSTHVINERANIFSAIAVNVLVKAKAGSTVDAALTATATDYRGVRVNVSAGVKTDGIVNQTEQSGVVGASGTLSLKFFITYEMYVKFTGSKHLNAEKAAAILITISVLVKNGADVKTFLEERSIAICTPVDPARVNEGECQCAANAGKWRGPKHSCPVDASPKIGDGVCDQELNNEQNCYDNGDCCYLSCIARNSGVQGAPVCVNDDSKCLDPTFNGAADLKPDEPEFGGVENGKEHCCNEITGKVKAAIEKGCSGPADKCSDSCSKAISEVLCNGEKKLDNYDCAEAKSAVERVGCYWKRCPQEKQQSIGGFSVYGDGSEQFNPAPVPFTNPKAKKEIEQLNGNTQQQSIAIPLALAGSVGVVVGLLVGVVSTRRRQAGSEVSMF